VSEVEVQNKSYPILPLRDIVIFPHMVVPLFVGRDKSICALDAGMRDEKCVLLLTQKDASDDDPCTDNLYNIGVLAKVLQLLRLPDGTVKVLVEGGVRVKVLNFSEDSNYFEATAFELQETWGDEHDLCALGRTVLSKFEKYAKLNKTVPQDAASVIGTEDLSKLADSVAAHVSIPIQYRQKILEILNLEARLEYLYEILTSEVSIFQIEKKIRGRVKTQMEKTQKEYYLNEQIKAIQRELSDTNEGHDEIHELEKKIEAAGFPKHVKEKATSEIRKLRQMAAMSAEAAVVRNYLDWLVALPWKKKSRLKKDLVEAEKVLNIDHYGLEEVKERILEFLAVQKRNPKAKGLILCLVGAPGVGKTSLAKSIARATGREFVRNSLGGIRDEAEIRGHRRTYIGSMPGKIIQSMKKVKAVNPLILLDEIDKMGNDFRGDPAAAMLEVLDPEQNGTFFDHYLDVEYDLSNVMFVMTANTLDMPRPLVDRMEVVRVSGYTEGEKLEIAKRHLLPKQFAAHAIKKGEISIHDSAFLEIVRTYTREAGVRNFDREIAKICRKSAYNIEKGEKSSVDVTADELKNFLGVAKYRFGLAETEDQIGAVTGLAWTEVGGDLLTVEAISVPGKGRIKATGKLGDVMKESVEAASSYVKANGAAFGIRSSVFANCDIHIHVPEGATPKDGPSAGIAIIISIVSLLTGVAVKKDVAMTGEITLRGNILAIGGLKEKLLAALRGGIAVVLIPKDNERDLPEIPDVVKENLNIVPVMRVSDVIQLALVDKLTPIVWDAADEVETVSSRKQLEEEQIGIAH
jgi:ATP-dependent Lon protease